MPSSFSQPLDLYCERVAPGLSGEPVNTLTNLAFLWAAGASWQMVRHRRPSDRALRLLVILMVWIAAGSALFHTTAQRWAQAVDVLPIALFQILWVWLYAVRVLRWSRAGSALLLTLFALLALAGSQLPHALNGSLPYVPALVILVAFGIGRQEGQTEPSNVLLIAAACFAAALYFRSIDLAVCDVIPFGTHFLWHILNSVVLYLTMKALMPPASKLKADSRSLTASFTTQERTHGRQDPRPQSRRLSAGNHADEPGSQAREPQGQDGVPRRLPV